MSLAVELDCLSILRVRSERYNLIENLMEFLHEVKMHMREVFLVVRAPALEIGVLDDKDRLDHHRIKDWFPLFDIHDSAHDGTEVCADLQIVGRRVDPANALNDGFAFSAMGFRHKVIFLVACVGISLDCLDDQLGVILGGEVEQVDVGRLVVISSERCVLEASVQDTGSEMFAEVCHRHVREERVE